LRISGKDHRRNKTGFADAGPVRHPAVLCAAPMGRAGRKIGGR
jgi:hypothetical protein